METSEAPVSSESQKPREPNKWRRWLIISSIVAASIMLGLFLWLLFTVFMPKPSPPQTVLPAKSTIKPTLTTQAIVSGYDHIWDIRFLPTNEMLFTERTTGKIYIQQNNNVRTLTALADVYSSGEGGLLGLEVDPNFTENHYIYACFDSTKPGMAKPDVRVARFVVAGDLMSVTGRTDIVTGMPVTSGRHSGCRVKIGPDGYLWIGTGDSAAGGVAIDHKNLGGKILRVDRDGKAAPGNLGGDFDPRIYSYGHRNVQGLAFFPTPQNGVLGVNVEHGSSEDDEVNLLEPGNFGWAPPVGEYTELNVKMTDKTQFPDAIDAIWSSGTPTIAPSGATFLSGKGWLAWDGALAVAVLKDKYLLVLDINTDNKVTSTEKVLVDSFGRLRTAVAGPDSNLYISTDNGKTDQIIRVTPH